MSKILITGSAELIGSALVAKLSSADLDIIDCNISFKDNPTSFYSGKIIPIPEQINGIIH